MSSLGKKALGIMAATSVVLMATTALAVPWFVEHSGHLVDTADHALSGSVDLTVRLYDVATGGSPLFTQDFPATPVVAGYYSVMLALDEIAQANLFTAGANQYLEIDIGGQVLTPRWTAAAMPWSYAGVDQSATATFATLAGIPTIVMRLGDVSSCPSVGDVLRWNGTAWSCAANSTAAPSFASLTGVPASIAALASLSCVDGNALKWSDGTGVWVCGNDSDGSDFSVPWANVTTNNLCVIAQIDTATCLSGDFLAATAGGWNCKSDQLQTQSGVDSVVTAAGSGLGGGGTGAVSLSIDDNVVFRRDTAATTTGAPQDPVYTNAAVLKVVNNDATTGAWKVGIAGTATAANQRKVGVIGLASGTT